MPGTNIVTFISLVLLGSGLAEMDAETKEHITSGIEGGQGILEAVGTLGDPKTSKLFDSLEKMSAFAGAAGGLISLVLIFIPESDSEELKYMKEKFAEVNTKLDKITEELDDVKNLITFENQRSAYLSDASKVITGSEQLIHFLQDTIAVKCKTEKDCLRKRLRVAETYEKSLDVKQSLYTILKGTVKKTSVFGDPLLELLKTTYKCDVTKIDYFASGVLKLAFKGQQVILAHEKLTASTYSIVASMKDWLTMVYDLRSKTNEVKNDCYENIKEYMKKDINDKTYQVNKKSNKDASRSMKKKLDSKYPWVYWTIFAYGAYGADQHWTWSKDGAFWNMPKNKEDRKRNIIAVAQDKGTYLKQRVEFAEALKKSIKYLYMDPRDENKANKLHDAVSTELKKNAVWGHVKTFTVLKTYSDFQYVNNDDHHLYWYNEELVFQICHRTNKNIKRCRESYARFIAVFRSQEEIDGIGCTQKCNGHGTCKTLPLTTHNYCECKPFYQGQACGSKTRAELAANAESILSMTFQIPKLTDIYFEIKDMRDFLGSSLNKVFSSVIAIEKQIEKSFDDLEEKITQQFRWSGLLTQYSDAITNLKYYLHRFHDLPSDNEEKALSESRALASHILAVDGVEKWLFELNYLFVGRSDFSLGKHEPLMIVLMDHHKDTVCTKEYRDALDNAWRQLVLLQTHGFMMWIQALGIKDKSTDFVTEKFIERSAEQIKVLDDATCNIKIAYSSNLQSCVNGYYLHPGSVVENKCKKNYYVEGKLTTTCSSPSSKCRECKCNKEGSSSQECSDITGTCTCKNRFKGEKCNDRDCTWSKWGSWGTCSKTCGYGGKEARKRKIAYKQAGSGKRCEKFGYFRFLGRYLRFGLGFYSYRSCFKKCCSGEFHCTKKKKCIPSKEKCDYVDDCGDNQDEDSCEEKCKTKYTKYNADGGGDAVYIDRHRLDCGTRTNL